MRLERLHARQMTSLSSWHSPRATIPNLSTNGQCHRSANLLFLDMYLNPRDDRFAISIHYKETGSHSYLNFCSSRPFKCDCRKFAARMTTSKKQRPPWSLSWLRVVIPSNLHRREDARQPRRFNQSNFFTATVEGFQTGQKLEESVSPWRLSSWPTSTTPRHLPLQANHLPYPSSH